MKFYEYSVEINGRKSKVIRYFERDTPLKRAKALIVKYAKKMGIEQYLAAIRKRGTNVKYRAMVADFFDEVLSSEGFSPMQHQAPFDEDPADYAEWDEYDNDGTDGKELRKADIRDFYCGHEGADILAFYIGKELFIESNILASFVFEEGYFPDNAYFFLQDNEHTVKVNVTYIDLPWGLKKASNSANLLYVYRTIDEIPKSREELHYIILEYAGVDLSLKTIGKHIHTLQKLGMPIRYKGMNRYQRSWLEAGEPVDKPGFYWDSSLPYAEIDHSVIADCGTSLNPLLVLRTLWEAKKPLRQAEIIRSIEKTYGVKIARAAVGRHIQMLIDLEYDIEKTKDGAGFRRDTTE